MCGAVVHIDLPKHVSEAFAHAFEVRLIESSTASWEMWFALLEDYVARENHPNAPAGHVEDGYKLGQWCNHQRQSYKKGEMSEERVVRLEALGFVWDPLEAAWEKGFEHLELFVAREGHANMPTGHVEDGYRLGTWCGNQRQSYRQGRMSEERIARLEALPGWTW